MVAAPRILILIWLFSPLAVLSQNVPPIIQDYYPSTASLKLKGKVNSCHTREFSLINNTNQLSKTSSDVEKVTFLNNGYLDESISYTNGAESQKVKYKRISPYYVEISKVYLLGKEINYDAIIFDSAGRVKEYFEEFLKEGSGFKNNSFQVKKCLTNQKLYYSNKPNPDSILCYENKKFFHNKIIYEYNNEGLPLKEDLILNDPLGNRMVQYQYDLNKSLVQVKTTFMHPENKRSEITNYVYNGNGDLAGQTNFEYADETFHTVDSKTSYQYKYEYDKQGNWIKATKYEGDKIESVLVRTILYY